LLIISTLLLAAFIGFVVSFSACFKQSCSAAEDSAWLWVPAGSLLVSIPLAVVARRQVAEERQAKLEAADDHHLGAPPLKLGDRALVTVTLVLTALGAFLATLRFGVSGIDQLTDGVGSLGADLVSASISLLIAAALGYLGFVSVRSL
jgi:hypothetical protein